MVVRISLCGRPQHLQQRRWEISLRRKNQLGGSSWTFRHMPQNSIAIWIPRAKSSTTSSTWWGDRIPQDLEQSIDCLKMCSKCQTGEP